jgi:drug/metabolite transporter (DMT)-like permease
VLAIALGWAVLGDPVGPGLILAGALVIGGLVLVNRTGAPGTARR